MNEKICKECNLEKPVSDYYRSKDGYYFGKCKICHTRQVRIWRSKNKDKVSLYNREYNSRAEVRKKRRIRTKEWWKSKAGKEYNKNRCRKRHASDPEYHNLKRASRAAMCDLKVLQVVKERDGSCQMCGTSEDLQFDHIFPQSLGGLGTERNLQLLCGNCNLFKSDNLILPAGGMLIPSQDLKERLVGVPLCGPGS